MSNTQLQTITNKLQIVVNNQCDITDKYGNSMLSTCDCLSYGWDRDIYIHREEIIQAIRSRGYNVSVTCRHGVINITTSKTIKLN